MRERGERERERETEREMGKLHSLGHVTPAVCGNTLLCQTSGAVEREHMFHVLLSSFTRSSPTTNNHDDIKYIIFNSSLKERREERR